MPNTKLSGNGCSKLTRELLFCFVKYYAKIS